MKLNDIDAIFFGVEDVAHCTKFLTDFGLREIHVEDNYAELEVTDGSKIFVWPADDPRLPKNWTPNSPSTLRMMRWRVEDQATLDEIAENLGRDREVRFENGILYSHDDEGFGLAFRVAQTPKEPLPLPAFNVKGVRQRDVNSRVFEQEYFAKIEPRNIGHVVLNCADYEKNIRFYMERLGFKISDSFTEGGSFLRTAHAKQHHTLFMVNRPPGTLNHVAFYVRDLEEVIRGGMRMKELGWLPAWGPGRHVLGSNHFWYFQSPLGGNIEYSCDIDHIDENWEPKELKMGVMENMASWQLTEELSK